MILSYVYRASYTVRTGTCRPTITSHTMIPHHPARGLQAPQILPVAQHHLTPVLQVDTILVVTRTWVRIDLSVYPAALVVRHHPTPVLRVDSDLVVARTWVRIDLSVYLAALVVRHHPTPVLRVDSDLVVARTWVRIDLSVYLAALVVRHHPTPVLRVDTLSLDHQVAPALPETKKWTGKEQGILLRVDLLQDNTRTSC